LFEIALLIPEFYFLNKNIIENELEQLKDVFLKILQLYSPPAWVIIAGFISSTLIA